MRSWAILTALALWLTGCESEEQRRKREAEEVAAAAEAAAREREETQIRARRDRERDKELEAARRAQEATAPAPPREIDDPKLLPIQGPRTRLSELAGKVQTGMSRRQAIGILGRPTWVRLPKESEEKVLELLWENGHCGPVRIDIDPATDRVTGSDGGHLCYDPRPPKEVLPEARFKCPGRGVRSKFCRR